MADESPGRTRGDELRAELARQTTPLTLYELAALLSSDPVIDNSLPTELAMPLVAAGVVYFKAFLETLAQRNVDAVTKVVHARFRDRRKGNTRELLVGPQDDSAATLIITSEMPDEARLALLDLDVTADEVRGRVLRWDEKAMAWRPEDPQD